MSGSPKKWWKSLIVRYESLAWFISARIQQVTRIKCDPSKCGASLKSAVKLAWSQLRSILLWSPDWDETTYIVRFPCVHIYASSIAASRLYQHSKRQANKPFSGASLPRIICYSRGVYTRKARAFLSRSFISKQGYLQDCKPRKNEYLPFRPYIVLLGDRSDTVVSYQPTGRIHDLYSFTNSTAVVYSHQQPFSINQVKEGHHGCYGHEQKLSSYTPYAPSPIDMLYRKPWSLRGIITNGQNIHPIIKPPRVLRQEASVQVKS